MENYLYQISTAKSLDRLDAIVEIMANDESLTNDEYCALYQQAERIAKIWNAL